MSFAEDARREIARTDVPSVEAARAELSAALLCSGGVAWQGPGRYHLTLETAEGAVARRYFGLLKHHFQIVTQIEAVQKTGGRARTHYRLVPPAEEALPVMKRAGLYDPDAPFGVAERPPERFEQAGELRRAYLTGTYLGCGTVTNPEKEYHLEFALPKEATAQSVLRMLRNEGFEPLLYARRTRYVVCLKSAEGVSDALALLGAGRCVLELENKRIQKEMRGRVNRQVNCDRSNIARAMTAAETQLEAIRSLERNVGLDRLSPALAAMARARLEHPDASLAELGENLIPPLAKSCVRSRLNRLLKLAEDSQPDERAPDA